MTYTDLTPGAMFMYEGAPYIVISYEFHRMQMRKAIVRSVIRNLLTGQQFQKTFTASEKFDPAPVDDITVNFLYNEGDIYYFMDVETYEQHHAEKSVLGEKSKFLTPELKIKLTLFNGNPVSMVIPKNVNLKVVEAPTVIKGNTVSATFKSVVCENNITVSSCPIFIKEGDIIKVDTETGDYIERVKS